jgi:tetratricopeptide (TPR) repeat protein
LTGLSLPETAELFALRRANSDPQSIEDAHAATGGHALWLDLLAAQVARPGMDIKLEDLVRSIENDSAEIPDATLRSIWQGLRDREQIVLQVLAETVRPTTALQIADYLGSRLRYNKVIKAVVPLRELNLIVVKKQDDDDAFELHPLIRTFIRKTSKRTERVGHINSILAAYAAMLNLYRPNLASASRQTVRQWLESAELYINADRVENALEALHEIGDPAASEVPNEFARISSMIFETSDLNGIVALRHFDNVFTDYCRVMVNLGRTEAASEALDRYEATLSGKEARFINLCDMRCYLHWTNRNYAAAIHWGTSGAELKRKSGVDTNFDSRHNLALAQRDAGAIDAALEYFLSDSSIEKAAEPNNFEADRNEAFYGNIGRCLQLMGQIEPAISCLRKSAILAHRVSTGHRNENQAYAREWLAELFQAKGEHAAAMAFYVAARAKWEIVSPPRSARVTRAINALAATSPDLKRPTPVKAENIVLEWIGS